MRVLCTGGAGFIGSHVVDAFLEKGYTVDVVDNLSTGSRENVPAGAELYVKSINDPAVRDLLAQNAYDMISHHAAQIDVRKSVADPPEGMVNDVAASVTLFEWAVKYGVKYILFASSGGAMYGEQEEFPASENHPVRPQSPYGLNKWIVERYLDYYHRQYGIGCCSLRYANVYGPRQSPFAEAGVVAIFMDTMMRNGLPVINGSGEQTRDYIFISDVVSAHMAAAERRYQGALNIGTGAETSVNTMFSLIRGMINPAIPEKHGPPKVGEQLRSVLSWDRAHQDLQWEPEVPLEEGLAKTVEFYKTRTYRGVHSADS